MRNKNIKKAGIMTASLLGVAALQNEVAAANLFDTEALGSGAEIRNDLLNTSSSFVGLDELKCGEGKCGEGKCGEKHKKADKADKKECSKKAAKKNKDEKAAKKEVKKEMKKDKK